MSNVISLAEVRAARQQADAQTRAAPSPAGSRPARPQARPLTAAPKPARAPVPPPPLHWRESQAGNLWTKDAAGVHFVIFQNRRGWGGRATLPSGEAWFENMPSVSSAEEARAWAEEWLASKSTGSAAQLAASQPAT
jgi:hypothetical protein